MFTKLAATNNRSNRLYVSIESNFSLNYRIVNNVQNNHTNYPVVNYKVPCAMNTTTMKLTERLYTKQTRTNSGEFVSHWSYRKSNPEQPHLEY